MFSTFLEQIGGYFNRRFILPAFFPTLAFMALSLGVIAAWWGPPALLKWWQTQPTEWQTLLVVGVLGSVLVVTYLFYIFQTSLTQFYEGYWRGIWPLSLWGPV